MSRQALSAILIAGLSANLRANEVVHVNPAATTSWADMLRRDQAVGTSERERQELAIPFRRAARDASAFHVTSAFRERLEFGAGAVAHSDFERSACAGCPGETALAYGFQAILGKSAPPDTMGAVGPSHVMTMLNTQVQIQTKNGSVISTVSRATFWAALPFGGGGDPQLIYDAPSGRWIATSGAGAGPTSATVAVAVSATDDPAGTWRFYLLPGGSGDFPDFPRFGTNGVWIAVTATVVHSGFPDRSKMWVIDKSTALAGGPLTVMVFPPGFDGNTNGNMATLQPCVTLDSAEPTLYIVDNDGVDPNDNTNVLRLSQITGTGPSPLWSVVPGSAYPGTGLFRVTNLFGINALVASQCGQTPGSGISSIETNDARLSTAVFRNGRIWAVHHAWLPASGTSDRISVFWYQIDPIAMPDPLVQSGVIDGGPSVHHIYPSIAANCADDACIGFTRSSAAICPEGVYCTRLASDPLGTMRPVRLLKRGAGRYGYYSFDPTTYRWGDYSATVVDPADDRTFWTIQEYVAVPYGGTSATNATWGTSWGRITQDCNLNGLPDLCEANVSDCNQNGISDACECCHGDVNGDGVLNAADIGPFISALVNPPSCAGPDFMTFCRADVDRDGVLGLGDIPAFVQQLLSTVGCP